MDIRDLCSKLIEDEGRGDTPFGLYVLNGSDPRSEVGRHVEREVFYDFFGNSPALLAQEYERYDRASMFFCVVDHLRSVPAAVARIILPSPAGQKSFHDLEKDWGVAPHEALRRAGIEADLDMFWDIATLAISQDYRGDAVSGAVRLGLFQGISMVGSAIDQPFHVTIVDVLVADLMQNHLHRPLSAFPGLEPHHYLGSASSLPMYLDGLEYRSRIALIDPDAYEMLFMGRGLEAMISSPLPSADTEIDESWFLTA